jgi:hypothetical protein
MSKKTFTEKEIEQLSINNYVKSVSQKQSPTPTSLNVYLLQQLQKVSFQDKYL